MRLVILKLGCRVEALGLRVEGLGLRVFRGVLGFGFWVEVLKVFWGVLG